MTSEEKDLHLRYEEAKIAFSRARASREKNRKQLMEDAASELNRLLAERAKNGKFRNKS